MSTANGAALLTPTDPTPAAAAAAADATPPAAAAAPPGNPPAANSTWYDTIEDSDLKGYLQNKGWKDPAELAVGYRNLEKLVGHEKVPLPKGADDKDGWARVYDALGRPKSAEEYKLALPEGADPAFAKAAAGKFHELGLNPSQAAALTDWWNGQAQSITQAQTQQQTQAVEEQLTSLKSEWGGAWDENVNLGQRAAREFGLDQGKLAAMETALGTGELLKFMARVGRGLTEHKFEGGQTTNSFGMTPDAAKARLGQLREDREWSTKYLGGNADARAEMDRLMKIAYPQ
jgi:hypothetical protein